LAAQHQLIAGIHCEIGALPADRASSQNRAFPAIVGCLIAKILHLSPQLRSLLLITGRFS